MYFKGLTFIFSEDPPENHLKVIGGLLLKYYVLYYIIILKKTGCPLEKDKEFLNYVENTCNSDKLN